MQRAGRKEPGQVKRVAKALSRREPGCLPKAQQVHWSGIRERGEWRG